LSTPTGAAKAPPGKGINALESYNKVRYLLPCTTCLSIFQRTALTASGIPTLSSGTAKIPLFWIPTSLLLKIFSQPHQKPPGRAQ